MSVRKEEYEKGFHWEFEPPTQEKIVQGVTPLPPGLPPKVLKIMDVKVPHFEPGLYGVDILEARAVRHLRIFESTAWDFVTCCANGVHGHLAWVEHVGTDVHIMYIDDPESKKAALKFKVPVTIRIDDVLDNLPDEENAMDQDQEDENP